MKPTLLSLLCVCCFFANAQKFNIAPRLSVNTPAGEQKGKFKNAYNLGAVFEMGLTKTSPVKLTVSADAGINGSRSLPYEFNFGNTTTKTSIQYTSCLVQMAAGLRFVMNEGKTVRPYVGAGAGVMMYNTSYMIEDPEHDDGCHALEAENVLTDHAFTGRLEGGLRWLTGWEVEKGRRIALDFGVSYLRGTRANFIRLGKPTQMDEGTDYNTKFQTPTNEVHEHAIGKQYNTGVNQLQYHVGLSIPLSPISKGSRSCKTAKLCQRPL